MGLSAQSLVFYFQKLQGATINHIQRRHPQYQVHLIPKKMLLAIKPFPQCPSAPRF
jgi:hypothetical protein